MSQRGHIICFVSELATDPAYSVYSTIDPSVHYDKKSCKGKVVFVAGASRGIGEEIAIIYARAGASVVLGGRKQAALDAVKKTIRESVDGVQVLDVILDVTKAKQVDDAVKVVIAQFGKLDIVIANAGTLTTWNQRVWSSSMIFLLLIMN